MRSWVKRGLVLLAVGVGAWMLLEFTGSAAARRPDFTATTLDGRAWSLPEYRGSRPVILNFFATW